MTGPLSLEGLGIGDQSYAIQPSNHIVWMIHISNSWIFTLFYYMIKYIFLCGTKSVDKLKMYMHMNHSIIKSKPHKQLNKEIVKFLSNFTVWEFTVECVVHKSSSHAEHLPVITHSRWDRGNSTVLLRYLWQNSFYITFTSSAGKRN